MKKLISFIFALLYTFSISSLGARESGLDPDPDPVQTWSDADLGLSNGCKDGSRDYQQAQNAYDDIMYNPSISMEYKDAYQLGWGTCRTAAQNGTIIEDSGMTEEAECFLFHNCTGTQYITIYIYFVGGSE